MIGRLNGTLIEKQAPNLMVDIQGVGYDLLAPMTTFYRLPELDQSVVLHTHFAVSETSQQLYGFISRHDREFFRVLIKVSGVGPKMAVGIMSIETADIVRHIMDDNVTALVKVPGVGKKTAERLIIETRDKLGSWGASSPAELGLHSDVLSVSSTSNSHLIAEAESALIALGYKPTEAAKAVSRVATPDIVRSEEMIRLALRSMLPS
jgi:Holliday junction DNA helicase subunit RuvA